MCLQSVSNNLKIMPILPVPSSELNIMYLNHVRFLSLIWLPIFSQRIWLGHANHDGVHVHVTFFICKYEPLSLNLCNLFSNSVHWYLVRPVSTSSMKRGIAIWTCELLLFTLAMKLDPVTEYYLFQLHILTCDLLIWPYSLWNVPILLLQPSSCSLVQTYWPVAFQL